MRLVREVARAERYAKLEINALVQVVIVTDNRRAAAAELTGRWSQLTPDEILQSPFVQIGTVEQLVDDLQARRNRRDISSYVIFEKDLDDFSPVVEIADPPWLRFARDNSLRMHPHQSTRHQQRQDDADAETPEPIYRQRAQHGGRHPAACDW